MKKAVHKFYSSQPENSKIFKPISAHPPSEFFSISLYLPVTAPMLFNSLLGYITDFIKLIYL